jgi:hypothetical protein
VNPQDWLAGSTFGWLAVLELGRAHCLLQERPRVSPGWALRELFAPGSARLSSSCARSTARSSVAGGTPLAPPSLCTCCTALPASGALLVATPSCHSTNFAPTLFALVGLVPCSRCCLAVARVVAAAIYIMVGWYWVDLTPLMNLPPSVAWGGWVRRVPWSLRSDCGGCVGCTQCVMYHARARGRRSTTCSGLWDHTPSRHAGCMLVCSSKLQAYSHLVASSSASACVQQ